MLAVRFSKLYLMKQIRLINKDITRRSCHVLSVMQNRRVCRKQLGFPEKFQPSIPALVCRFKSHYENWSYLQYEDLVALIQNGDILLIDVRDAKEIKEQGEFPGAVINIPVPELKKALQLPESDFKDKYNCDKPTTKDTHVVFASFREVKSSAALEIAHKLGYAKSRQYKSGYEEWRAKQNIGAKST